MGGSCSSFLFLCLVERPLYLVDRFPVFLVIHGILFRYLISLCGMLFFIVQNSSFLEMSHTCSWCTESSFSLLVFTVVCRFSRSVFILFQSAYLYM